MLNTDKAFSTTLPEQILKRLDLQHALTHVPKKKLVEQALDEFLPLLKEKRQP